MLTASDIIQKYIAFFEKRKHKRIPNSPLVPQDDPTTLFTSSGMQPLVPYLLGEPHPSGKRLVNVQNCFRAQDIDEVGDNRHTTFFRMLGNWSLGDYFKQEQLRWFFEFLTDKKEGLNLDPSKLYVTVFEGVDGIPKDEESEKIWRELFESKGINPEGRIFYYGPSKNWWSRVGGNLHAMPVGEPGGPDSEVFYQFDIEHDEKFGESCHPNCQCGRFLEIGNSVFMQYKKTDSGFEELPNKNVDFGGGLERLLMAIENQHDMFQTSLYKPVIEVISNQTNAFYEKNAYEMRIIADHVIAAVFIASSGVHPSNKEQGYILRRLIRRALDNYYKLADGNKIETIIETIAANFSEIDPVLKDQYESIKLIIFDEEQSYKQTLSTARSYIDKKYPTTASGQVKAGDELKGTKKISSDDAFDLYQSHGLSPTQIKSLGFNFDDQEFSELMKKHQEVSRAGAEKKFKGGLADERELTIKGHTATHLLHQALRDVLGDFVHQTGSNITSERVRFDFNSDRKLTEEELKKIEKTVNEKIKQGLPVYFKMLTLDEAKKLGAIGLFDAKYQDTVKVYFIGPSTPLRQAQGRSGRLSTDKPYSIEFCGGPHVNNSTDIKKFKIIKEEGLGRGNRRIYAIVK